MAATNFTPIQLYFSTTLSAVPSAANLANGELAINIRDGTLYYKDWNGVVQVIATKGAGTIGGSTTQIQYNNAGALAGNAAMVFNSATSTTTLTTLNLTNALGAIYGGTAQSTYAQGDVVYASAANTLAKLGIGVVNYILTSTGSIPQWVAPSSIAVLTATNLAGGLAGSVPYQSALDTTTFLAIGAANRVMTSTGTAPQWVTSLTGLTGVSSSSITDTGLTSGRVTFASTSGLLADSANLTFNGTTLTTAGLSNSGFSTLVKTLTLGDTSFNGTAVFAAATPAKLYMGTGTVTDVTSAISATNTTGAIASLAITPIAATNTGVTYTNASTLYIAGAPSAGTNITITNPFALYIAGGTSYLGGAVTLGGTVSGGGNQINNVVIGTLTPLAGAFTTVTASTPIGTASGGTGLGGATPFTANGVVYASSTSALATGSALTFDGTNFKNSQSTASPIGIKLNNDSASNSAGSRLTFQYNSGDTGYVGNQFDGTDFNNQYAANRFHIWLNNNTEGMRLTSTSLYTASGIDVVFGASSPIAKLTVINTGDANKQIVFSSNATYYGSVGHNAGTGANEYRTEPTTGFHQFFKGTSATADLTLNSSGNLGLGVTPSAWSSSSKALQIGATGALFQTASGFTFLSDNAYVDSGATTRYITSNFATLYRQQSGQHDWFTAPSGTAGASAAVTSGQSYTVSVLGSSTLAQWQAFFSALTVLPTVSQVITATATGSIVGGGTVTQNITFTQAMTLDASGNLLVGVTSASSSTIQSGPSSALDAFRVINTAASSSNQYGMTVMLYSDPNNATNYILQGTGSATERATIRSNGGLANYSANNANLSDRREKTNFAPATSYLDKICAIPVQTFNYIDQNLEQDGGLTLGVVAQDVQAVAPELVMESNWASKDAEPKMRLSIYQTDLQYALMKCIQEQQALITQLTARITALETA